MPCTLDPTLRGPEDFWTIGPNLKPDQALEPGSLLYVNTEAARGEFSLRSLYIQLELNPATMEVMSPKQSQYLLFAGHRGCGKSTELRRLVERLDDPQRFFVIFLDASIDLDAHNLQYADVLLSQARKLCEKLSDNGVAIDQVFLSNLEKWFQERILSTISEKAFQAEMQAGAKAQHGLPFLVNLFAKLTTGIKYGSTYKDELRQVVRNTFAEFAEAFNQIIAAADEAVCEQGLGRKLLFVVDGTDRLQGEDTMRFFVDDVNQLQQVSGNFIYCAPIHILSESNLLQQRFDHIHRMPMIKLCEQQNTTHLEIAYEAMREMVYRRVGPGLFDDQSTVDYLIEYSGGHPRDLVRLLNFTRQRATGDQLNREAAEKAVADMAVEYKYLLEATDYELLWRIDNETDPQNNERARFLLQNLALLEYNSFWWRTHPVVRTLPGYRQIHGN